MRKCVFHLFIGLFFGVFSSATTRAHQTTDSYLSLLLTNRQFEGRWAIALRDLDHVLTIDADADGEVSDAELKIARPKIEKYAFRAILFEIGGEDVTPDVQDLEIDEHDDAIYAALVFTLRPRQIGPDLLIIYQLFAGTDPLHRGLFRLDLPERTETAIFSPSQPTQRFLLAAPQKNRQLLNFIQEGIWHIWTGFDHILFLIALLLPSVLKRAGNGWHPSTDLRGSLLNVLKIVTAFTLAHSITLSLAALGMVRLPSRFVESIIALSVLLAAINNVKVIFPERIWVIAFGFGLIHGFGFASALTELHLTSGNLAATLVGFNVGVEIGQLAIVILFVPMAFRLRTTRFYREFALRYGSLVIALLAGVWLIERVFDRRLLPF